MKTGQCIIALLTVVAAGLVTAGTARAGNLTPSNAPAPTMHTLEELYQKLSSLEQRMNADGMADAVDGMVLVPAGAFEMGDFFAEGWTNELPRHTVTVSAFYMDQYEVTKAQWDEVYNWAITNGYTFTNRGLHKESSHPVHTVNWYDCVKWCNARSQKEGRTAVYSYMLAGSPVTYRTGEQDGIILNDGDGYRLPTEAEWEKAARGGATGRRFPWSADNSIQHTRANYYSSSGSYDISSTHGHHPSFTNAPTPYTSPVGSFAPNGYGLYDMLGNVQEWCWDWYLNSYYSSSPGTDPRGPASGSYRVRRGGSWNSHSGIVRVAYRDWDYPDDEDNAIGLRCVRAAQ